MISLQNKVKLKKLPVKIHGLLLEELVAHTGLSQEAFGSRIGKSRVWVYTSFNDERLALKNLISINKEFGIPMEYWEGTYELPITKFSKVSEEAVAYNSEIQKLNKKITDLEKNNQELSKKLLTAYERNNELSEQLRLISNRIK